MNNRTTNKRKSDGLLYYQIENFLTKEHQIKLMNIYENIDMFPIGASDLTSTHYTHSGEAIQASKDLKCSKDFLSYDETLKLCIFPSRIDIFKHFLYYGGYNNLRESFEKLVQRVKVFINYQFLNYTQYNKQVTKSKNDTSILYEPLYEIFNIEILRNSTKQICNNENAYLLPYQTSLTIQIPGQTLPSHTDLPYFKSASRYTFPQWLLVVMQHSNLFNEEKISEVQAVVYIHPWNQTEIHNKMGGELLVFDKGPNEQPQILNINGGSAILIDGQSTIHATNMFMPNEDLYFDSNVMDKDTLEYLQFDQRHKLWKLYVNGTETNITYSWQNVRASVASRLWCFPSKNDAINYDPYKISDDFSLQYVMDTLKNDLLQKQVATKQEIDAMDKYDLGLLLMEHYIKYPTVSGTDNAWIPINYCLIFRKLPQNAFLSYVKSVICE